MRFLTCEPNLMRLDGYVDEADEFYQDPESWLNKRYFAGDDAAGSRRGASHIVLFDELHIRIASGLRRRGYENCDKFFHTHFPDGRVSEYIVVMCADWWTWARVYRGAPEAFGGGFVPPLPPRRV